GSDTLYGYNHAGGTGVEMLIGGSGNDTFFAQGGANVTMIGGQGTNTFTGGTNASAVNRFITGSTTDTATAGAGWTDYVVPEGDTASLIQIIAGTGPGVLDFSQFSGADNVTFYLEHGMVLAGWGAQTQGNNSKNSTIEFGDIDDYEHEAYGPLSAFQTILGGKGGDTFNVWEGGSNATPLVLDGQQGSDVYNILGYDAHHSVSDSLNVIVNDATDTTETGNPWSSGATSITLASADANLFLGEAVTGAGIADGTMITNISGSTITLNQATTAAATSPTALTFNLGDTQDHNLINLYGANGKDNTQKLDNNGTGTSAGYEVRSQWGSNSETVQYVAPALGTDLLQLAVYGGTGFTDVNGFHHSNNTINVIDTAATVPTQVWGALPRALE